MLEWLKRHAWKACIRQKRIGGSNPPLSAIKVLQVERLTGLLLFQSFPLMAKKQLFKKWNFYSYIPFL